jgi:glycine/D-amino acid oxidase-like deaminating enzyme
MEQQKILIIGAGISGIATAKHFIDRGHSITLIDSGINRSSIIAAGMINPIVFRRMTKSWRVDEFLPYLESFYTQFEKECNESFFIPITIRRMFSTEQERSLWIERQNTENFKDYIFPLTESDDKYDAAFNQFGSGRVKRSAYISTSIFLESTKKWISHNHTLITDTINYTNIDPVQSTYNGNVYDHIIFCEGVEVRNNPWFQNMPINPTQGETLTITSDSIIENESLNRKCFILPIGNNEFKVGSTYIWDTYNSDITDTGRAEIEKNITYLTDSPYTVIDQNAGIRPTTLDRRPLIGSHPSFSNIHIFNGLGAKGYMLAPLLAKEMVEHILDGKSLDREISISRLIDKGKK